MDYFLIYLDERKKIMAAVPDEEGVYKTKMPFDEYNEDITTTEVVIAQIKNFNSIMDEYDADYEGDDCIYFKITGKFVASQKISDCIKKIGFTKFFTSIIKKHIENAADFDDSDDEF